jgi:putative ABC transport system permease protein
MTSDHSHPPELAERLLIYALGAAVYRDDIVGDLREAYREVAGRRSVRYARWWYRIQALRLSARYVVHLRPHFRRGHTMDQLAMDVRYALRSLGKRPLMTLTVVVTLALGIGANAAVFGMIDALVVRPYGFPDVDRAVLLAETSPKSSARRETVSPANFLDWRREAAGVIDHMSAMRWWDVNLVGRDQPERTLGFFVSPGFFAAVGVQPALGRGFVAAEEIRGQDRVVVLSDGLWRRRFGGDPSIVGQSILVDGAPWLVVGIMPRGFGFPMTAEVWAPLSFDAATPPSRTGRSMTVIGRLASGRTLEEAQATMSVIGGRLARDYPVANRDRGVRVYTLSQGMTDAALVPIFSMWQAAAIFVLLIACANVANLLLARGAERGREIAIRLALGSSRGRVIRESLIESGLLAALSIPLSIVCAWVFLRVMRVFMPARIVRFIAGWEHMTVDGRLLAATLALGVCAAIVFGLLPALQFARGPVSGALKSDGRTGAGPGRQRTRRALVVAEVALALPLLVAATLSVQGVARSLMGWQGYDPDGVLAMKTVLPAGRYPTPDTWRRFTQSAVEQLAVVPGVGGAAAVNVLPSSDSNTGRTIEIAGQPQAEASQRPAVDYRVVSANYFDVMRVPVVAGRGFTAADREGTDAVGIVSASMAKKFWPHGDAVGGSVKVGDEWVRIVGTCADLVHDVFDAVNAPTLYRPYPQAPTSDVSFAVRTGMDPMALAAEVRRAIDRVDSQQPTFDVMTMRQMLSDRTIAMQYVAGVMGLFGGLALVLALVGLYAVMSYLVAQRVREIGVRIALGATPADVTRLTIAQAARLTAIGLAIGFVVALALGRFIEAALLGTATADVKVPILLALTLAVTALASSYLPARRAAAVDPMVALRSD